MCSHYQSLIEAQRYERSFGVRPPPSQENMTFGQAVWAPSSDATLMRTREMMPSRPSKP
jgi:hypothetical protein